uniref:Uncharacterized protein n=1 Tax=Panagrolaimus sp. PS1159 TaxID=55785 RepID=A0AC35F5I2_9BILA
MTETDTLLSKKDKQILFFDNGSEYSNLNLNQNYKSPFLIPVQSHRKQYNTNRNYVSDNYEGKRKSSKIGSSSKKDIYNGDRIEAEKLWKKDDPSTVTTTTKSILSLHISTYENSIEAAAFDSSLKKENSGIIQKQENVKQIFAVSTLLIQNPFEFPRQQNEKVSEPEIYQFRESQRLFNPNESKTAVEKGRGNKHDRRKKFNNSQNGVILENNLNDPNSQIIFTILDFTKDQSFYVLRYSYKPSEDEEMPLQIFDNINYEGDIKNFIREQITRNKSYNKGKFECKNLGNGIFVVKAICVFSTGSPTKCFTNICGEIEFNKEVLSKVLLADVTFDCWLQFSFVKSSDVNLNNPSINHITYKFHSIEKVNTHFDFAFDAVRLFLYLSFNQRGANHMSQQKRKTFF